MERVTRRGLNFLLVLFVILSVLLLMTVVPFFAYVFFGAFAAFLVFPLYERLGKRIGRHFAAWVTVAGVYAVIFLPIAALVASVLRDLANAAILLRERGAESIVFGALNEILPEDLAEQVASFLGNALVDMGTRMATQALPIAMELLLGFFIFGFICFYTLITGRKIVSFSKEVIPLRDFRVFTLFNQIKLSLNAVFYGVIAVAVIQGSAGGIVWMIAGLPNPFFYGAVMFLLSIVPFAGPSFVLIPVGILHILQGEVGMGIFLIASGVFFVGSIDNFLRPVMVSKFGDINPAMVVVGLAGGLVAFGIVGMVLGPLIFALWMGVARELHFEVKSWKHKAFADDDEEEQEHLARLATSKGEVPKLEEEGGEKGEEDETDAGEDEEPGQPAKFGGGPPATRKSAPEEAPEGSGRTPEGPKDQAGEADDRGPDAKGDGPDRK